MVHSLCANVPFVGKHSNFPSCHRYRFIKNIFCNFANKLLLQLNHIRNSTRDLTCNWVMLFGTCKTHSTKFAFIVPNVYAITTSTDTYRLCHGKSISTATFNMSIIIYYCSQINWLRSVTTPRTQWNGTRLSKSEQSPSRNYNFTINWYAKLKITCPRKWAKVESSNYHYHYPAHRIHHFHSCQADGHIRADANAHLRTFDS